MFEICFLFSSIISINNIKNSFYSLLIDDKKTIINCNIIKIVYKINSNKMLKINEIINKTLRRLVDVVIK